MNHSTPTRSAHQTHEELADGIVAVRDLPGWIRDHASLPQISYVDQFSADASDSTASPEQWARAMFGDVPNPGETLIWRGLLGLRLSKGKSSETVAGWQISERGTDWIRLESASWFLSANLIVRHSHGTVSLATLVSYDRFPANIVWSALSAVHRRLAPGLVRGAVATVQDQG